MEWRFGSLVMAAACAFAFAQLFIVFLFDIKQAPLAIVTAAAMVLIGYGARLFLQRFE